MFGFSDFSKVSTAMQSEIVVAMAVGIAMALSVRGIFFFFFIFELLVCFCGLFEGLGGF